MELIFLACFHQPTDQPTSFTASSSFATVQYKTIHSITNWPQFFAAQLTDGPFCQFCWFSNWCRGFASKQQFPTTTTAYSTVACAKPATLFSAPWETTTQRWQTTIRAEFCGNAKEVRRHRFPVHHSGEQQRYGIGCT